MWISRKEYNFLKENAEKNINAECEILKVKEELSRSVAKAMVEYSKALESRERLIEKVRRLENELENYASMGFWAQGSFYDTGDVCSKCNYDSGILNCDLAYCPSCHTRMRGTDK